MSETLVVEFLGTRGAFPLNLPETQKIGTETSSIVITADNGDRLIVDAGTGLNRLTPSTTDDVIVLSHFHYDHVLGLPYFLMRKHRGRLILATSNAADKKEFADKLSRVFGGVGFPAGLAEIYGNIELRVGIDAETMGIEAWQIESCELAHPGTAFGYRISHRCSEAVICYLMDHEHGGPQDCVLEEFARYADLIIFDAAYEAENYVEHEGYGDSTIEQGQQFRKDAQANQIVLMGHAMERLDADYTRLSKTLDSKHELLGYDGLQIRL